MSDESGVQDTRERLLAAALAQFSAQGYEAASVADICRAAGVSKGAFYHHYESKAALFIELLNRWLARLPQRLGVEPRPGESVPAALRRMAGSMGHVLEDARGQVGMFLEFWSRASRDPQVWRATIEPYRAYTELFSRLVQRGIDEGSLRPCDPEVAARALVSLGVGLLLQASLEPAAADWPEVARDGVALLLNGLAAEVDRD